MKALLLAAGRATRLGDLSRTTPKCLHEVGGEALLDRIVRQLQEVGVEDFLINTHHLSEKVYRHVSRAPWADRATMVHEDELLGTLGTLRANVDFFQGGPGWILHADNFIEGSLRGMAENFDTRPPDAWGCMLTFEAPDPSACGVVELDSRRIVVAFHEKVAEPPGSTASAATFIFDPRVYAVMESLPARATDISHDLIPRLLGRLVAVPASDAVIDIGTPEGLEEARRVVGSGAGTG